MQPDPTTEDTLTPDQLQQREQTMWKLRLQGCNQEQIAQHFGLDLSTVSSTLKRVRQQLAAEFSTEAAAERIAEQTQQLFYILSEALEAWQHTKPKPTPSPQNEAPVSQFPSSPLQEAEGAGGEVSQSDNHSPSQNPTNPGSDKQTHRQPAHVYLRVALQALASLRQLWSLAASQKTAMPATPEYKEPELSPEMQRFREELRHMREHGLPAT
jgi:DNA-binding CsgD family transcriptional regulator